MESRFTRHSLRLFVSILTVAVLASSAFGVSQASPARAGTIHQFKTAPYLIQGDVTRLKSTSPENQLSSEECYMFAFVEGLETFNVNHRNPVRNRIVSNSFSSVYLYVRKLQAYIEDALLAAGEPKSSDGISAKQFVSRFSLAGGSAQDALLLMQRYGIVSDRHMRMVVPFKDWDITKLNTKIQALLVPAFRELKDLRRRQIADGTFNPAVFRAIALKNSERIFRQTVFRLTGPLPDPNTPIIFDGRKLTPLQIEKQYGYPDSSYMYTEYPPSRSTFGDRKGFMKIVAGAVKRPEQMIIRPATLDQMMTTMERAIDERQQVQVSIKWVEDDFDGFHVLTLIGYERDRSTGQIVSWLFKNSWGRYWGFKGEAFFTDQDVRKNVVDINIVVEREILRRILDRR